MCTVFCRRTCSFQPSVPRPNLCDILIFDKFTSDYFAGFRSEGIPGVGTTRFPLGKVSNNAFRENSSNFLVPEALLNPVYLHVSFKPEILSNGKSFYNLYFLQEHCYSKEHSYVDNGLHFRNTPVHRLWGIKHAVQSKFMTVWDEQPLYMRTNAFRASQTRKNLVSGKRKFLSS